RVWPWLLMLILLSCRGARCSPLFPYTTLFRSGGNLMAEHATYQPRGRFTRWLESRLPIIGLVHSSFVAYPTPRNLNYWWTFGAILSFMLVAQIVTGVVLAMHYVASGTLAFSSVESIMRDVNYGWLLR